MSCRRLWQVISAAICRLIAVPLEALMSSSAPVPARGPDGGRRRLASDSWRADAPIAAVPADVAPLQRLAVLHAVSENPHASADDLANAVRTSIGAISVYEAGETSMILALPMWWAYASLAPGLALAALVAVVQAGLHFRHAPMAALLGGQHEGGNA